MSRLYAWIESDTRRTELTTRGDQFIRIQVNYGSKRNSKKAIILYIDYPKDKDVPIISIDVSENIKVCKIRKTYP